MGNPKRHEPVPLFKQHDDAYIDGDEPCRVINVSTYCLCCDSFRDSAIYMVKTQQGSIEQKVTEKRLDHLLTQLPANIVNNRFC